MRTRAKSTFAFCASKGDKPSARTWRLATSVNADELDMSKRPLGETLVDPKNTVQPRQKAKKAHQQV
jgi:hypothetical protein